MNWLTVSMFIYGINASILLLIAYFLPETKDRLAGILGGSGLVLSFIVSVLAVFNFLILL